jgi:hypothetical protein
VVTTDPLAPHEKATFPAEQQRGTAAPSPH